MYDVCFEKTLTNALLPYLDRLTVTYVWHHCAHMYVDNSMRLVYEICVTVKGIGFSLAGTSYGEE
jgi:hypothetical protein